MSQMRPLMDSGDMIVGTHRIFSVLTFLRASHETSHQVCSGGHGEPRNSLGFTRFASLRIASHRFASLHRAELQGFIELRSRLVIRDPQSLITFHHPSYQPKPCNSIPTPQAVRVIESEATPPNDRRCPSTNED